MDEFVCPWCGEDLLPLLASMAPTSYDGVYEAHAPECGPFQAELNLGEKEHYMEPLCSGDGE